MLRAAILRGAVACLAAAVFCTTAKAQLFRAYLASDGSDANPCTLQQPCRLLPAALTAVASGGEIWMLDSANYNTATVNITKSVSILAVPGVVGSVVALNGGPAISITAAGLNVALRNLVIGPVAGAAPGTTGVSMSVASSLTIENSLIASLPATGLAVSMGTVNVISTTIRNVGNSAISLGDGATATIRGARLLSNGNGIFASAFMASTTTVSISDSIISGGSFGVSAQANSEISAVTIAVTRSTIVHTQYAIYSSGAGIAEVNLGSSLIVDNNYAWYQQGTGAAILSLGNNQMSGNTTSFGVLTPLAAESETLVGGIISSSSTWTASNSPYRLTSTVQVDYGVTLTVEPGVTVIGAGHALVVGGTLRANGTQGQSVRFNRVSVRPVGSMSQGNHLIDLRYVIMTGGSLYAATGNSGYGTLQVRDSRLEGLSDYLYIWYPTSSVNIERNIFLNSGGLSIGFDARSAPIEVVVRNNYFAGWTTAFAVENWAAYGSATGVRIEHNTFATQDKVALVLPGGYEDAAITATENWWGTTDVSVIASMIFDENDDITAAGTIPFLPILIAPDAATPVP